MSGFFCGRLLTMTFGCPYLLLDGLTVFAMKDEVVFRRPLGVDFDTLAVEPF